MGTEPTVSFSIAFLGRFLSNQFQFLSIIQDIWLSYVNWAGLQ